MKIPTRKRTPRRLITEAEMKRREEEQEVEEAASALMAMIRVKREAEAQAFYKTLTANELGVLDILDTMAQDAQDTSDQINDHQDPPAPVKSKKRKIVEEDDSDEDQTPPAPRASKKRKIIKEDKTPTGRAASKKRKVVEEDNSDETLAVIKKWIKTAQPQENLFGEQFSKPIRKQLTESDTKQDQNRLMLGKEQVTKLMFPHFKESEIECGKEGINVLVFGPDGESQEMMFKMWNGKTPVLTCGWNKFVSKYELKMHSDFLTVSIFRHIETDQICFAIDSKSLPVSKSLSRRILKLFNGDS